MKRPKPTTEQQIEKMKEVSRLELQRVGLEYDENATLYDNLFQCPNCNFRSLFLSVIHNHNRLQHDSKKETLPN